MQSVLEEFRRNLEADPAADCLHYYGRTLSRREVADLVLRLTSVFAARGAGPGAPVAIGLQNTPVFVAAALAAWNTGAPVVPVNPMLRRRELRFLLEDAGATVLVAHAEVASQVGNPAPASLASVLVSGPGDLAGDMDADWAFHEGPSELLRLVARAEASPWSEPGPDDVAFLTYTSGTTGNPKGAVNTHENITYVTSVSRAWFDLAPGDGILAMAPLFHITGAVEHMALAAAVGLPLTLTHRFEPNRVGGLVARYEPAFTVGSITAFVALMNRLDPERGELRSLRKTFSGGAPVPAATVERYRAAYGSYIHNIYGLTETASACIAVPLGAEAPVDPQSGALSIGVPLPGTEVRVVGDDGTELPPGEVGEICIRGRGVMAGYWNRPEETAASLRDGWLSTGDVGRRDPRGWIYIVDRKKDMIIASGYKVWPRDVEDVLYEHPAVAEAAVVGVPDDYRGETVHAYVSLRPGTSATEEQLIVHCRAQLAAYKAPRRIHFRSDLPKTPTGKIKRRDLRNSAPG